MQEAILNHENLTVIEDGAEDLIVENGQVAGVIGLTGEEYRAPKVVITTGTFLKGEIHIGAKRIPAGRVGEAPAIGLSDRLYTWTFRWAG
jgi:tRNA uridine 5-carboxymethylaminomethyl modification enzyme